ncbi:iron complex transport system substrate-binding protein [Paenibacillus sp. DS2015]|uniref:ABC transporter substrate-binding protein n=1 Tax=Paenibacillus sp. DS2015 TaxID=3373917 RepID=UPI003D20226F
MLKRKSLFATIALMLLFTVFVTACGGANNNKPAPASSATVEETVTPEKEEAVVEVAETAPTEFRSYTTDKGNVQIPVKPQRIITDYYGGELLSVGANVVGVEPSAFDNPFLVELLKETQDVGYPTDLEKTLELKPDLIVVMYDENYDALSKIAPTLHIPYGTTTNINETVKLFGDIVGAPDKAEEFIAAFDQKATEGREKLKGIVNENDTFGIYELTDKGDLWIFGDNAGRGGQVLYNALQLNMPAKNNNENQTLQLSMEVLPEYSADYMFLTTYDPEKKGAQLEELKKSSVWNGLSAAKNNHLFYNDFDTYYRYDPIAITAQIDLFVDMIIARSEESKK